MGSVLSQGCNGDAQETVAGAAGAGGAGSAVSSSGGGAPAPSFYFADANGERVTSLRYGEEFSVGVEGLAPGTMVTVETEMAGYVASATFEVAAAGTIDTREDAPIEGTYSGVEPEGLVWSAIFDHAVQAPTLNIAFDALVDGEVVATDTFERRWLNDGLIRDAVTNDGLVGALHRPADATDPLPAVLVLGGSEGGLDSADFAAAVFAGYGYAALALAYFDEPGLPAGLTQIPLEYFETALAWLSAHAAVDPQRVGVIGGSRGGELALMLGAQFPVVGAVVGEIPSSVRWGSASVQNAAAWSYQNMDLPYVTDESGAMPMAEQLPNGATGYRLTPIFDAALDTADPNVLDAATIAVESIQGPVLLLSGSDDGIWPSCRFSQMVMGRLNSNGHSAQYDDESICFMDAGHFAPMPGWSTTESYAYDSGPYWIILGGTPAGTAHAQRQGLDALISFLGQAL